MKCGVPPVAPAARRTNSLIWKCGCVLLHAAGRRAPPRRRASAGSPASITARTARPQPIVSTDPADSPASRSRPPTGSRQRRQRAGARRIDDRRALAGPACRQPLSRQFIRRDRSRTSIRTIPSARARCSRREIVAVDSPAAWRSRPGSCRSRSAAWRPCAAGRETTVWLEVAGWTTDCNSFLQCVTALNQQIAGRQSDRFRRASTPARRGGVRTWHA